MSRFSLEQPASSPFSNWQACRVVVSPVLVPRAKGLPGRHKTPRPPDALVLGARPRYAGRPMKCFGEENRRAGLTPPFSWWGRLSSRSWGNSRGPAVPPAGSSGTASGEPRSLKNLPNPLGSRIASRRSPVPGVGEIAAPALFFPEPLRAAQRKGRWPKVQSGFRRGVRFRTTHEKSQAL